MGFSNDRAVQCCPLPCRRHPSDALKQMPSKHPSAHRSNCRQIKLIRVLCVQSSVLTAALMWIDVLPAYVFCGRTRSMLLSVSQFPFLMPRSCDTTSCHVMSHTGVMPSWIMHVCCSLTVSVAAYIHMLLFPPPHTLHLWIWSMSINAAECN